MVLIFTTGPTSTVNELSHFGPRNLQQILPPCATVRSTSPSYAFKFKGDSHENEFSCGFLNASIIPSRHVNE